MSTGPRHRQWPYGGPTRCNHAQRRTDPRTRLQPASRLACPPAGCLARDSYLLTSHNALATTAELLGVDVAAAVAKLAAAELSANGDGRAQVITPVGRTQPGHALFRTEASNPDRSNARLVLEDGVAQYNE